MRADGTRLDVVTWHHYYLAGSGSSTPPSKFGTAAFLNTYHEMAKAYEAVWRGHALGAVRPLAPAPAGPMLWMGETGGAGGATATAKDVTGSVRGLFWWVDKLAFAATTSHSVVLRQEWSELVMSLKGGGVFVAPCYWLALLWKRLLGRAVLVVAPAAAQTGDLRVYAFTASATANASADASAAAGAKKVAIVAINLGSSAAALDVTVDGAPAEQSATEMYSLAAPPGADVTSKIVALNGMTLHVGTGGALPDLAPVMRAAGAPLLVPPLSVNFVLVPV